MNFNDHSSLRDQHAFLGASKYHWVNYDDEKLYTAYTRHLAVIKGVELHNFAAMCISLGQKLPKSKKTLNQYVNDAIGFKMIPEQPLFYSINCFGTADAISFKEGKGGNKDILRIHDLKTGITKAHMEQLEIYAALFCLEYKKNPKDIFIELRIYQSNEILIFEPEPEEIIEIMDKIIRFDKQIEKIKNEV